jgi:putative tryptophan/tyrosine transport system substrate-binding protein
MKRREFISGLGGAAAWPLAARAQQTNMPLIGYLNPNWPKDSPTLPAFLHGLKQAGFVEGQNVAIEYRWAEGRNDRLPALAVDLVNRRVAVIAAIGGQLPAIAAKAATSTIPIVFNFGGDPVRQGLVASLSHPGGNATGSVNLTGQATDTKAVQFLRELVPAAPQLALLVNPTNLPAGGIQAQAAAHELRWEFEIFEASTADELDAAFEAMAKQKVGAVNVVPDTFFTNRRAQIVALATRYGIPASYYFRDFVIIGGLMSYGADFREPSRLAGNYVGRILKGEKPADLPVQEAVKVELLVNLKTAKALGLTVPLPLLVRADEVIDE